MTATTAAPRAFHHVGLPVPDLDAATRFVTEAFGAELLFTAPGGDPMTAEAAARLNLPEGDRLLGLSMLRAGGSFIELFAFDPPSPAPMAPWNRGGVHIAFAVNDLEAALARAVAAGGRACSGINLARSPGFEGLRWVYVEAPWGQTFELVDDSAAAAIRAP
jgi:catechol 2,3-dioxygenase-like lactoylglutathione lyase family enzyme